VILKDAIIWAVGAGLLTLAGPTMADEYRPDEYMGLDLSKAVFSPKPLGPPSEFAPIPVEAKADRSGEAAQAHAEPSADAHKVLPAGRARAARAEHLRAPARARLARRHGNPLDAQARDTRIQIWPCRSGGICNWH
jgi:hypothetical protein